MVTFYLYTFFKIQLKYRKNKMLTDKINGNKNIQTNKT